MVTRYPILALSHFEVAGLGSTRAYSYTQARTDILRIPPHIFEQLSMCKVLRMICSRCFGCYCMYVVAGITFLGGERLPAMIHCLQTYLICVASCLTACRVGGCEDSSTSIMGILLPEAHLQDLLWCAGYCSRLIL